MMRVWRSRPSSRGARRVWNALVKAGHTGINLTHEPIGAALEMCGNTGGWMFSSDSSSYDYLGITIEMALAQIERWHKEAA